MSNFRQPAALLASVLSYRWHYDSSSCGISEQPALPEQLAGRGALYLACGSPGAGKESLLRAAQAQLQTSDNLEDQNIVFLQRVTTAHVNNLSHTNKAISEKEFERMRDAGDLAISW